MIPAEKRGPMFRQLKSKSLDELAEYHAFNASDLPVEPRDLANAEFMRRQTDAQLRSARATAWAAVFTAIAATGAAISAIVAVAIQLHQS